MHTRSRKPESCDTIIDETVVCEQRYSSEPRDVLHVEVVRGLVQEQDVRLHEDGARERELHLPAAGKRDDGALDHALGELEAQERRLDVRGGAVALDHLVVQHGPTTVISCWSPWMSCSTYTVRSSSAGGNSSTWPLLIALVSVDLPQPLGPHKP